MTCKICTDHYEASAYHCADNSKKHQFLTCSHNYKYSTVSDHEKSKLHCDATAVLTAQRNVDMTQSQAAKTVIALKEHVRKQIEVKFRNVHALVKLNRPLSDFIWLNELDRVKGFDHGGNTYDNLSAATNFLEHIAMTEKSKLQAETNGMKFFSLTMDGSTDDGVTEQEIMYMRSSISGKIVSRFLCIGEPQSTGSSDLHEFFTKKMEESQLDMQKFIGFGCDGASNMLGCRTGLVTRLKAKYPEFVCIHCLAHRLELSFRDVFRDNGPYKKLSTLLLGLFYFYKNSQKQRKGLKETMQILDVKGTLPHRVGGSRWMPHIKKALQTLFKTYSAFITHLQSMSHTNPKAEGLAKLMEDFNVMIFAILLQDLISPLSRLSLLLQTSDITLGDAYFMIDGTVEMLKQCKASPSLKLSEVQSSKSLSGYSLKMKGRELNLQSITDKLVTGLVDGITKRFCMSQVQSDGNSSLLKSTMIASFKNWPETNEKEFGECEISTLVDKFNNTLTSQDIDVCEIQTEWQLLKHLLYKRYGGSVKLQDTTWQTINASFSGNGVSNVLGLIDLVRALPPTSVANETALIR